MQDDALADGWHPWTPQQAYAFRATARATQQFEAYGGGNAAAAGELTRWFRKECLEPWTRVWIQVAGDHIASYVALQSGSVEITTDDAKKMRLPNTRVPATFITHLARHTAFPGKGREAVWWAGSIARRANDLQRTAVLMLDPYDAATEQMWRERFKFRAAGEKTAHGPPRLYMTVPSPRA